MPETPRNASANTLEAAKLALAEGDRERAFAIIRGVLAQSPWSVAQLKACGDLLASMEGTTEPAGEAVERVAVIGGCTTGVLLPAVRCALAEEGRLAVLYEGPFGAFRQEVLDPSSGLHGFEPDTVLIVRSWRELRGVLPQPGDNQEAVESAIKTEVRETEALWTALSQRHGCRILQHELELGEQTFVGAAERSHPASQADFLARLNERLREAAGGRVAWLEIVDAARRMGSQRWSPPDIYHFAKLPIATSQLGVYARLVQGAWRLGANRTKKVLVTDLDNTLWGGVIGDDGTEGIELGPGTAKGEGFEAFAQYLLDLQRRGVVLAVCSKNEPDLAVEPFREHPHMPLDEDHFAVINCSWVDKASSLREIARVLNLGLDSMVFVDDNPAECQLVRRELPEVTAIHLSGDPGLFPSLVEERHLFDRTTLTQEDVERGRMYRSRAAAMELEAAATDLDSYLEDLAMQGSLDPASPADLDRVAQLELKTNQFNVATARFSRADVEDFFARPDHDVVVFRLSDRFTDHGLVSSLVARTGADRLVLLNWTMSCRVFSRGAEDLIRNSLLALCRARGLAGVEATFRRTAKNGVIVDLFPRLGFERTTAGEESWWLASDAADLPCHIAGSGSLVPRDEPAPSESDGA